MIYLVTQQPELYETDYYKIISVPESLNMLKQCQVLQYDSETTGLDPHLCTLLSAQFGNKRLGFQMVIDCTTVSISLYKDILETTMLVGHNLKFDLQFLYNYSIIPRKVYDTMIVEQLLHLGFPYVPITPEEYKEFGYTFPYRIKYDEINYNELYELSFALDAVAKKYLDIELDKTVRGQIIWRGLDTQVVLYAAKDVEYLEDIMKRQVEICKKLECLKGAKLECDFVPVIAYLEWCGIKLDAGKWTAKMKSDLENLNKAKKDLDDWLLEQVDKPSFKQIKKKYIFVNNQMDLFEGWDLTPKVTLNWSSSKQVIKIAKVLGFNTIVQDEKTGEDKDSVLEKHLKAQKGINDKFLELYFKYQEYAKVVSSFGQGHLDSIHSITGRLHTTFKQLGAKSGRMSSGSKNTNEDLEKYKKLPKGSCKQPNMQQLPSDEITRGSFVSPKGCLMLSADFSALEARLGADIYNEPEMLREFTEGSGDMHSLCAKMVFAEELKDVEVKDVKKVRPDLRKKVKSVEFAKQFGGTAFAIAGSLGCSIEDAQRFSDYYDKGFKGVTSFKSKGSKEVRNKGYVLMSPITGHKMYWWDWNKWKKRQQLFDSSEWSWSDYKVQHKGTGDSVHQMVKEHFKAASKWDRMALNAPTQGCGAVIIKQAATDIFNWIIDNNYFNKIHLCAIVHDELVYDYPEEVINFPKLVEDTMQNAAAIYCKSLPIPAEAAVGDHWIH